MVSRASAAGSHPLREAPSLRRRGSIPLLGRSYFFLLQSGHGHWSQPQPVHASRIMARSYSLHRTEGEPRDRSPGGLRYRRIRSGCADGVFRRGRSTRYRSFPAVSASCRVCCDEDRRTGDTVRPWSDPADRRAPPHTAHIQRPDEPGTDSDRHATRWDDGEDAQRRRIDTERAATPCQPKRAKSQDRRLRQHVHRSPLAHFQGGRISAREDSGAGVQRPDCVKTDCHSYVARDTRKWR